MKWIDEISYVFLIGIAILMALMPFNPEPHLVEKVRMLMQGELHKAMDIFDLFWHLLPTCLLLLKLVRAQQVKKEL